MKVLPTLLLGLTLLGSVMAPMAKADLSSDYGTQQTQAQNDQQLCQQVHQASQYGFEDGNIRFYIDENNQAWGTKWGYNRRCSFTENFPMNVVYQEGSSKLQHKIEGNAFVRYVQTNGVTSRAVWGYRF